MHLWRIVSVRCLIIIVWRCQHGFIPVIIHWYRDSKMRRDRSPHVNVGRSNKKYFAVGMPRRTEYVYVLIYSASPDAHCFLGKGCLLNCNYPELLNRFGLVYFQACSECSIHSSSAKHQRFGFSTSCAISGPSQNWLWKNPLLATKLSHSKILTGTARNLQGTQWV